MAAPPSAPGPRGPFASALVTGASGGLGEAVARRLATRGTRVVLAARRAERLEAIAAEIRAAGGRADAAPLDVARPEDVRACVARWDGEVGGLDLVLANAGVGASAHACELSWADVEAVLRVNVLGAFATVHAALEAMRPRGRGTIGGVSSLAAYRGLPKSGAYAASKAALSTFLETLRVDLQRTGVRVVDLRPGFVRTPMTAGTRHPMPFLMDVGPAADACVRALERGRGLRAFPWPMAAATRAAHLLPEPLWRLAARLVPK